MKRLLITLLLSFLAVSCASRDDIDQLNRVNRTQEQRIKSLEELRTAQANQAVEIDQLRSKIASLQGSIDELKRRLQVPTAQTMAPPPPQVNTPSSNTTTESMTAQSHTSAAQELQQTPPDAATTDPAQQLYDRALEEFNGTNYQAAQSLWAEFTNKYKTNPLAANAAFWQGECFYQMRDYPKAILAYQEVIGKYAKSPKYPAALLKQGISFVIIGKKEAGRLVLNDVIKKFPNSAEAARAKDFLGNAN